MLDKNNLIEKNNKYYLPSGYIRFLANYFNFDISSYTDRDLLDSEITFDNDEVKSIKLEYKRNKANYECKATFAFLSSGDLQEQHLENLKDNYSDNQALINAFSKLSSGNYTLTYELTPGAMNLTTAHKAKYYCTGEEIYVDSDIKYSIPGLTNGDYYYKKNNAMEFSLYSYNGTSKTFEILDHSTSYKNALPLFDEINPLFFNNESDSFVIFDKNLSYSLFSALTPELEHNQNFELSANNIVIDIDENGLPQINLSFIYDMGLQEEENIKITFQNVGTTSIPDSIKGSLFNK